jgi:glycosyltransferase involved in cell wall biosynthesis
LSDEDARALTVWIVNQYAGSRIHGMEFRHSELARELRRLGHEVVVISGSFSHLFARLPETTGTYTFAEVDGVAYCWVRVPRYGRSTGLGRFVNMLVFAGRLFRLPVGRLPAPDAIIVSSPSPFPIFAAGRWARRFRARRVFEVRDIWPLTLQELGGLPRWHPLVLVLAWIERRAYRTADLIVSVLPAATSHLVAHGADPARIRLIPNGIDEASLDAAAGAVGSDPTAGGTPDEARPAAPAPPGPTRFVVGFVGTLGMANALETLIDAARRLDPARFSIVIVGDGPEGRRLRDRAADLPHVTFPGPVPKADVPKVLRTFDACYVGYHRSPLYRFGISPNKVFDYLAAARPVILAADAPADPVRASGAGLTIPPDDPVALAAAIEALTAMSPEERADLGRAGRGFVEREHSYRELAARYAAALSEIAR